MAHSNGVGHNAHMADLLDRVRGEMRDRLQLSRAAVEETARLQAALAALDEDQAGGGEAPTDAVARQPLPAGAVPICVAASAAAPIVRPFFGWSPIDLE